MVLVALMLNAWPLAPESRWIKWGEVHPYRAAPRSMCRVWEWWVGLRPLHTSSVWDNQAQDDQDEEQTLVGLCCLCLNRNGRGRTCPKRVWAYRNGRSRTRPKKVWEYV